MRVEDHRGLKVGDTALFVGGRHAYTAAFHDHASQAEWHTLNSIMRVAGHDVDGVVSEVIAVVEWWRTIESLVALLHLVCSLESYAGLRPGRPPMRGNHKDDALQRWSAIAAWLSEDTDAAPKRTTRLISELRDFRNSVEHASRQSKITIKHSRLGTIPAGANLADAMEAMAISVVACDFLRFSLRHHDLMPQVYVPSRRHVFCLGLDILATELIFPSYQRVVAELGLTTDISPYPLGRYLRGEARLPAKLAVKALPDTNDLRLPEPLDLSADFEAFADRQPNLPDEHQFGIPRNLRDP